MSAILDPVNLILPYSVDDRIETDDGHSINHLSEIKTLMG